MAHQYIAIIEKKVLIILFVFEHIVSKGSLSKDMINSFIILYINLKANSDKVLKNLLSGLWFNLHSKKTYLFFSLKVMGLVKIHLKISSLYINRYNKR